MTQSDRLLTALREFAAGLESAGDRRVAEEACKLAGELEQIAATEEVELPYTLLGEHATEPKQAYHGDAAFDLVSTETVELAPGEYRAVGTELAVAIADGYAGYVMARSGLAAKHGIGLVNSPGLIDSGYRGELKVILINHGTSPFSIEPGDRIAQLMIVRVPTVKLTSVDELPASERGAGGLGSSGVKSS